MRDARAAADNLAHAHACAVTRVFLGHIPRQCDENWQNCFVFGLSQWIHGSSFLFPRSVESWIAGPEETKNQRGKSSA
jgi:hypothetical protein